MKQTETVPSKYSKFIKDGAQSRKNSITSDNLNSTLLGSFKSIIANQIEDKYITKVATMPLIPSPASSYDAIYTVLKRTGVTNWTYGETIVAKIYVIAM